MPMPVSALKKKTPSGARCGGGLRNAWPETRNYTNKTLNRDKTNEQTPLAVRGLAGVDN